MGSVGPLGVGSRVLAEWQGSGTWWAGTISAGRDGAYTISFDDGTKQMLTTDRIEPLAWTIGSEVTCQGVVGQIVAHEPSGRTLRLEGADGAQTSFETGACYEERGMAAAD